MRQCLIVLAVCLAFCLAAELRDEEAIAKREMEELNAEELQVAKQWKDLLARKRELARDQQNAQVERNWEAALEERVMDDYLEVERRQAGDNCIQGDVIFIVDSSGSIGIDKWKLVLEFVAEAVNRMDVGPQATRVGFLTYGNRAHIIFHLNNFTSAAAMKPAILAAKFLDENTNTSGGIYVARNIMFTQANGERPQAPNMAIVITDGESTYDHDKTIPYAQEAKAQGILLISIGVGDKISKDELNGIASPGGDGKPLVFQVGNYDMLSQIQDALARVACDPVATQPPPTVDNCQNDIPPTVAPPKDCDPVTCKNKCQYGFAPDKDNCLTCGCLPKPQECGPTTSGY